MAIVSNKARRHAIKTISLGLAAVVGATLFNYFHPKPLEYAEFVAADLRVYARKPTPPTGLVAIAAIDDRSIAKLGRWPWPRSDHARVVNALKEYQVAVIGFDDLVSERDPADVQRESIMAQLKRAGVNPRAIGETLGTGNDLDFALSIREQGETYLAYTFNSHVNAGNLDEVDLSAYRTAFLDPPPMAYSLARKAPGASDEKIVANAYLAPIPVLNRAARGTAYTDIDEDLDGVARSYPAVIRFNRRYCLPLFLALVDAYLGRAQTMVAFSADGVEEVMVAGRAIPVDEMGRMMVHFRGKPGTIATYSIADIIDHRVPPERLKGRIVLIGTNAHALGDRFSTPVGGDFPGVEIQANAVDNVLAGDFIFRSKRTVFEEKWFGWILGAAISVAAAFMTGLYSAFVLVALGAAYLAYSTWRLTYNGALIGLVFPWATLGFTYFVVVSYRYFTEGKEKRHLRRAFELYLNPDVVASVVDDPAGLRLGGERRHLSILFADIVGFTSRAERSEPEPLVALLNTYMTVMTNVIFDSGGVVDKLMGDGIMAFWGAPVHVQNPARDAVDCALRMLAELNALAQRDDRFKDVNIGIGICTGEAVVGNFGGEGRFDYSVIGDTVNLASRLEGLTRKFKVHLLVNRLTYDQAGAGYIAREIGLVKVKGKNQLVPVVEIAGHDGDGVDPVYYRRFAQVLERFHQGASPEHDLRALLAERPGDQVIAMCLERLESAPAGATREIVFEFDTK
jgi:adenylate cyclase